jgi:hypothetical protein
MGMMARYQQKSIRAAQQALGDETTVLDHAATTAGPNPVVLVGLALGGLAVVFALLHVLISGVLIFGIAYALNKPRNLVLTDRGLVLFSRSLGGKPAAALGSIDTAVLTTGAGPAQLGYVPLQLGPERDWIRAKDLQRFREATARGVAGAG